MLCDKIYDYLHLKHSSSWKHKEVYHLPKVTQLISGRGRIENIINSESQIDSGFIQVITCPTLESVFSATLLQQVKVISLHAQVIPLQFDTQESEFSRL
jgi:hypothetical protein